MLKSSFKQEKNGNLVEIWIIKEEKTLEMTTIRENTQFLKREETSTTKIRKTILSGVISIVHYWRSFSESVAHWKQ